MAPGNLCRVHIHTGEVGAAQGGAQLLQHQGLPQPGASAPALPSGAVLPQPPREVLDEGTVTEPVEGVEVGKVAAGATGQGERSI